MDGFYVQDSESTNLEWQNELLKSFTKLKNETEQDILFGIDSSLSLNSSFASMTGVELDASCISTASDLDEWMEDLFSMPHRTILWKLPQKEVSGLNQIDRNLNFLGLVLPGIPALEIKHLEQLRADECNTVSFVAVFIHVSCLVFSLHNLQSHSKERFHISPDFE